MVDRERYVAGEVEIGKRVETRTERMEIPLQREEVYIERHAVDAQPVDGAVLGEATKPVRVELEAEQAWVEKQAYVAEEVEVSKRTTTEQQTFTDMVRREVLDVRQSGETNAGDVNTG